MRFAPCEFRAAIAGLKLAGERVRAAWRLDRPAMLGWPSEMFIPSLGCAGSVFSYLLTSVVGSRNQGKEKGANAFLFLPDRGEFRQSCVTAALQREAQLPRASV